MRVDVGNQPMTMEVDVVSAEIPANPTLDTQVDLAFPTPTEGQGELEIRGVRETLSKILSSSEPNFSKGGPSNATS